MTTSIPREQIPNFVVYLLKTGLNPLHESFAIAVTNKQGNVNLGTLASDERKIIWQNPDAYPELMEEIMQQVPSEHRGLTVRVLCGEPEWAEAKARLIAQALDGDPTSLISRVRAAC